MPKGMRNFFVHTALAGLLGFGTLNVAFADDGHEVSMFLSLCLCRSINQKRTLCVHLSLE